MKKAVFNNKGFTLIELLIVCGMLGIVMGAIFTLYQTHQRSAYTQEEVVEVQQNLRIAMDSITRDIKMAGFLTPLPQTVTAPLNAAIANSITINTGAEAGVYARITANTPSIVGNTSFTVDSVDNFANGDSVRIIRPQDGSEPITGPLTVNAPPAAPNLTIGTTAVVDYLNGDIVVRTTNNALNPNTIRYFVTTTGACPTGQSCIARRTNEGTLDVDTQIVANNITNLQFSYILDDNTENNAPTDLSTIRAVRVTITGQTVTTTALSGGQAKTRQIASIVRIRNRR